MQDLQKILQETFGLQNFREGQKEVIESVVGGNDTIVFMPTWGWKSLTYQLPAIAKKWVAVIISPLISLMKDQVDKLNELGIRAELINSTISYAEQQMILNELSVTTWEEENPIKFLYVAPERLNSGDFSRVLQKTPISLIAIDEAHCISQWWHDFRPSYMKIKGFIENLRGTPSPHPQPLSQGERGEIVYSQKKYDQEYIINLAQQLRKNQTESESIVWELLRNRQFHNLKFRRQHPVWRYIADFYCDELKLIIELDGKIHENQKEYDAIRDEIIKSQNIKIIRIKNQDLENNISILFEKIIPYIPLPMGEARWGQNIQNNNYFPVIALTATATKKVRADIVGRIGLENYNTFTKWFDRKNIITIVRELSKKEEKMQKLYEIVQNTPGSGIVYCSSRKVTKEIYDFLSQNDISVGIYTGEMSADQRERMQQDFMDSRLKVIVATNAFGMGIDKKDIRFVVHYNLPGSIENYYQEVGRAGRDGKKSFGVVIASYGDTKIQEFFIENSHPPKEEILQLYDYLYKDAKIWEGKNTQIQETYMQMANNSWINNDLKVGTIIKTLEKYGIVQRGISGELDESFRGRWVTLIQEKRKPEHIMVDWKHQNLLKEEAYFKLEKIKKLLFYPSCRKRFILEYFGDEEDLKNLWDNCGLCDYCLEKSKLQSGEMENLVALSVFEIVLDVVSKFDKKYGAKLMVKFLRGSADARMSEWGMDKHEMYGVLSEYTPDLVEALIEWLIQHDYLEKTTGQYPLLGLTKVGFAALKREEILKDDEKNLQEYLHMKVKNGAFKKAKTSSSTKASKPRAQTYKETKDLFHEFSKEFSWYEIIKKISENRKMVLTTIESHLVKLYETWELSLNDMLKLTEFSHLKSVKNIVAESFSGKVEKLKPVKEILEENGQKHVSYFDIKLALAMIEKGDL